MDEKEHRYQAGLLPLAPITIVVGHYGVGKTNLSLNLAFDSARSGRQVTLIDLDVVNPYFRSSDYRKQLEAADIELISPVFAGSSLDAPSLSGAVYAALEAADADHIVIVDAGGDDAGATSLGRFAQTISERDYRMLYVVNAYRNLTQNPEDAAAILREIEYKAKLHSTGVVNNSHLQSETTEEVVADSSGFAAETADLLGLPLVCTTIPTGAFRPKDDCGSSADTEPRSSVHLSKDASQNSYVMQVYVRTPWDQ